MTITVYKSSDASAPVLTGQAGALAAILDACLVNGYGSQAAAGWGIAFTGTNQRAYRAAAGNRLYLALDDTGTVSARVVGYEAMTAVATGTNPFPTAAQQSGGFFITKSSTADATARPWMVIANDRFVYVFCYRAQTVAGTSATTDSNFCFGETLSYKSGDAFNTMMLGEATASGSVMQLGSIATSTSFAATTGHYIARSYTQLGTAFQAMKASARVAGASSGIIGNESGAPNFPDPVSGGMNLAETYLCENNGAGYYQRSKVPGLYNVLHNPTSLATAFNNWDTIAGSGAFAGITFILLRIYSGATVGYAAIQISGTWA